MSSPSNQPSKQKESIRSMFNDIAPRYDFLNHFLSLGIDKLWRKTLIKNLQKENPNHILDLATGTADLAIAEAKLKPASITGTDLAEEMLAVGRAKVEKLGLQNLITLQKADSENLPFADNSFDVATVAFGVRNYEDLQKSLAEMNRVLKSNAKAFILDFSMPTTFPVKQLYGLYFRQILPFFGKVISKNASAYTYLPQSVAAFPQGEAFLNLMKNAGFRDTSQKKLSFGIASLYMGRKEA